MKNLYVSLRGGLGNQLFQYAAARYFAQAHNLALKLDKHNGFLRDKFKRQYELDEFNLKIQKVNFFELIPFFCFRLLKKLFPNYIIKLGEIFNVTIISESNKRFYTYLSYNKLTKFNYFIGYFQSQEYFLDMSSSILEELYPPKPINKTILQIGDIIKNSNSIALCIRLYEECTEEERKLVGLNPVSANNLNKAIDYFNSNVENGSYFIFSTHNNSIINELNIPENSLLITSENYNFSSVETLWLISQSKHFIITNSSFYWWGAWLSKKNWYNSKQIILASNNFGNQDSLCKEWIPF